MDFRIPLILLPQSFFFSPSASSSSSGVNSCFPQRWFRSLVFSRVAAGSSNPSAKAPSAAGSSTNSRTSTRNASSRSPTAGNTSTPISRTSWSSSGRAKQEGSVPELGEDVEDTIILERRSVKALNDVMEVQLGAASSFPANRSATSSTSLTLGWNAGGL